MGKADQGCTSMSAICHLANVAGPLLLWLVLICGIVMLWSMFLCWPALQLDPPTQFKVLSNLLDQCITRPSLGLGVGMGSVNTDMHLEGCLREFVRIQTVSQRSLHNRLGSTKVSTRGNTGGNNRGSTGSSTVD